MKFLNDLMKDVLSQPVRWKQEGFSHVNRDGYRMIVKDGKQRQLHVYRAELALGRKLPKGAMVHHVDGNRLNNNNRNLVICPDAAYHSLLHTRTKQLFGKLKWNKRKHLVSHP